MKKLILLSVALFAVALVGCKEKNPLVVETDDVYGWRLTQWEVEDEVSPFPTDIYLRFKTNGSFDLYQADVQVVGFEHFAGTYTFDEGTKKLTGVYSDGEAWSYEYTVSGTTKLVIGEGDSMSLILTASGEEDYKLTYSPTIIPAGVINPPSRTRTAAGRPIL